MRIPTYKIIRILSDNKLDIDAQLKGIEFGETPYAFDLTYLERPQVATDHIEGYLVLNDIVAAPYPIVFICTESIRCDILDAYPSISKAPRFFNQKTKTPNVKEQGVLTRLMLKQKSFMSLRTLNYAPIFKTYSISHKIISELSKEAFVYEQLLLKIKEDEDVQ